MDSASISKPDNLICNLCRYPGSDLRILGCGCTIHARCAPLSLALDTSGHNHHSFGAFPAPNKSNSMPCPVCKTGTATGLYLIPLCFRDLERAVELRRAAASSEGKAGSSTQQAKQIGEKQEIHAEATYLLLSNNRSALASSGLSDREQQRTGRWTDEEIAYVDYLVAAFDQGTLPLPHGVKLNEFLGDMLICKSSRLTKKMKNAKLSTRSFELGRPQSTGPRNDCAVLSGLQEKFLMSIPSEPTQLELRFNITKQWRTHFSNLCVQIGYPSLDGKEWVASLEEMERRASNAEEAIRKVRRRRMGLALQTDGGSGANPNVYIGGIKADAAASALQPALMLAEKPIEVNSSQEAGIRKLSANEDGSEHLANNNDVFDMLDFDSNKGVPLERRPRSFSEEFLQGSQPQGRQRTFSEDFDAVLNDLMDSEPAPVKRPERSDSMSTSGTRTCSPFLDAIITYMENNNLQFQHADVWVPSFLPRDANGPSKAVDTEQLRLFHAGHATRGDLDQSLAYSLNEFGVYSDKFSFEPGHGLPGRVYSSGRVIWEPSVDNTDPKLFERSGGAKVYGIRTAVGIPLNTPLVGRIVVAMYSCEAVNENMNLALECANELVKYSPEPKWKLVIEMNDNLTGDPSKNPPESKQTNNPSFAMNTKPPPLKLPQANNQPGAFATQLVGCTSPTATNNESRTSDPEEQRIISLLGEHMPVSDSSAGEPSSSAANSSNLLPHFMSIRLLLLRPSSRRTSQQNEMIDILKNSFRAYAKDNRRSGAELANLLAKDWICLKATFSVPNTAPAGESKRVASISAQPPPPNGDSSKRARVDNLMPTNMRANSFSGPMKPPTQFIGRSSSMGFMPAPAPMAVRNIQQQQPAARRNSSFEPNSFERQSLDGRQPISTDMSPKSNFQRPMQQAPQQVKSTAAPDDGDAMWFANL